MKRTTSAFAVIAAAALTLTACGGGGGDESASASRGGALTPADAGRCTEDKAGGTITMGEYAMLPSFRPGQGAFGVQGAAQAAAVYDRPIRWNPEAEEFEPKLAEGFESNEDNTVWTLTLRDGVTFSNGDPLTAEDVADTLGLHQDPATRSSAMTDAKQVESVRVVDPLTVEYTLTEPWAGFPILLAGPVGEVIPEKAYAATSPEDWARNPIGAGAFTLTSYIPGQEAVLEPNPTYYGGPVCPTLKFIRIPGSQGTYEAFQTGEVQVGFLRGAKPVTVAQEDGIEGFEVIHSSGSMINLNTGIGGYDGVFTDERARQAFAHALDRDLIDQRLTAGQGQPTSALIAESSRFYDGQEGPGYDPEQAEALIAAVKADNPDWDGKVTLLIGDSPENMETGVAVKALLDAAGFDVTLESAPVTQVVARMFNGDFEAAVSGLSPSEADPASTFASAMTPGGSLNLTGVDDPELIAAITALKAADGVEAQTAALTELQEVYNRVVPFAVIANAEEYVVVDDSVKGISPTLLSTMLFDGAYVEK